MLLPEVDDLLSCDWPDAWKLVQLLDGRLIEADGPSAPDWRLRPSLTGRTRPLVGLRSRIELLSVLQDPRHVQTV